jgi:hypothetical protein
MLSFIEKHIEAVLGLTLIGLLSLGFVAWVQEHDARIIAEQTVKTAQVQIDSLQKQQTATAALAQVTIAALQKQAAKVTTPAQAVQALTAPSAPQLTDVPLNIRAVPSLPDVVTVDALPLFQELDKCKQDAVALNACSTELKDQTAIDAQKDTQIKALKKKKGFWARVKKDVIDTAVTVGIGAAIGFAAHR